MNCKCGLIMDEYPEKWECFSCGYKITKLTDEMSPRLQAKIIRGMKGYKNQTKGL